MRRYPNPLVRSHPSINPYPQKADVAKESGAEDDEPKPKRKAPAKKAAEPKEKAAPKKRAPKKKKVCLVLFPTDFPSF